MTGGPGLPPALSLPLPAPAALGGAVNAYLLPGPQPALVDPGPGTPEALNAVIDGLGRHGLLPDQLRLIVLTHVHPAHAGGAVQLAVRTGAAIMAHPDAEAWLCDSRAAESDFQALVCRAARAGGVPRATIEGWLAETHALAHGTTGHRDWRFLPLAPGQKLGLGDVDWRAEFSGGHSADHLALHHDAGAMVLTGDLLSRQALTLPWLDARAVRAGAALAQLVAAWRGLGRLRQAILWPGHGPEIRAHRILVARRLATTRGQLLAARGAVAGGADTLWSVADSLGLDQQPAALAGTLSTTAALLRWLLDTRQVERTTLDGVVRYARHRPVTARRR